LIQLTTPDDLPPLSLDSVGLFFPSVASIGNFLYTISIQINSVMRVNKARERRTVVVDI
jgi:hypothetical protein